MAKHKTMNKFNWYKDKTGGNDDPSNRKNVRKMKRSQKAGHISITTVVFVPSTKGEKITRKRRVLE